MDGEKKRRRRIQAQQLEAERITKQQERNAKSSQAEPRKKLPHTSFTHAKKRTKRKKRILQKISRDHLRLLAIAVLACVCVFCFVQAGSILLRSRNTKQMTAELEQMRAEAATQAEIIEETQQVSWEPEIGQEEKEESLEPVFAEATQEPGMQNERNVGVMTMGQEKDDAIRAIQGNMLPEMATLYARNSDLAAWLEIEGVLGLPVVYRDNSYYLTHDFDRAKSDSGTIFLDEDHPLTGQNLLLHGHNMKDGTMFGHLVQYEKSLDYLKKHAFVEFDTLWEKEKYVIFSIMCVSLNLDSPWFIDYYNHPDFRSDGEFEYYTRELQQKSMYSIPVDVKRGDALLTLSTCLDDDRLVIVARRIREGESMSQLRQMIALSAKQ